jgi:hypothetical protein
VHVTVTATSLVDDALIVATRWTAIVVLVRHAVSRRFLGLQVKRSGWDESHVENRVHFRRSSFRPAGSTYAVILGWDRARNEFEESCLMIPSREVAEIVSRVSGWCSKCSRAVSITGAWMATASGSALLEPRPGSFSRVGPREWCERRPLRTGRPRGRVHLPRAGRLIRGAGTAECRCGGHRH